MAAMLWALPEMRGELADLPVELKLPTRTGRPAIPSAQAGVVRFAVPAEQPGSAFGSVGRRLAPDRGSRYRPPPSSRHLIMRRGL